MIEALRNARPADSEEVRLIAPSIAEDGSNVYIECSSSLPEVDGFAVFVDRNPQPLVAVFWIAPEVEPLIKTRIKVAQTANIWVVARSRGEFFKTHRQVTVTVGGCGVGLN